MDTLGNRCPSCSARIDLNPMTQTWVCSSCGSNFTLEQMQSFNQANIPNNISNQNNVPNQSNDMVMQNVNSNNMVPNNMQQNVNPVPMEQNIELNNGTNMGQNMQSNMGQNIQSNISLVQNNQINEQQMQQSVAQNQVNLTPSLELEKVMRNYDQYHCNTCGTKFISDGNIVAKCCVYCGSSALQKDRIEEGEAPNLIIPFKKTRMDAAKTFQKLLKNKPLTPMAFRNIKNPANIIGLYVPFWAYDITCDGNISFHCADSEKWMDENYRYVKNSKFDTTMFAHLDYKRVLSRATDHFNSELMTTLEPFNLDELVDFNHAYLNNYYAEKYNINSDDAYIQANEYVMNQCVEMSKKETEHQRCELNQNNLYLSKKSANSIMLPFYLVQVNYKNKKYTYAMNGQTGKTDGSFPVGLVESIVCGVIVFILLVAVAYLFSKLGR